MIHNVRAGSIGRTPKFEAHGGAKCKVTRNRGAETMLEFTNPIYWEHWRDGRRIDAGLCHNGITNVGMNKLLDVMFHAVSAITAWTIGLISAGSFSALAAADTMASHAGWLEFVAVDEATRQEWTEGAASGRAITNASPVVYNINSGGTLKGVFITDGTALSGTTGTLWATALFNADVVVQNGDQVKITYTVSG